MKYYLTTFVLYLLFTLQVQASARHQRGTVALNLSSRFTGNGAGFSVSGDYFFTPNLFTELSFGYNRNLFRGIESDQYLFESDICYNFYQFRNSYIFGLSGFALGAEHSFSKVESISESGFVFFWNIGAQFRYYYNNYGFYISLQEYFGQSKFVNSFFQPSIGIVYLF